MLTPENFCTKPFTATPLFTLQVTCSHKLQSWGSIFVTKKVENLPFGFSPAIVNKEAPVTHAHPVYTRQKYLPIYFQFKQLLDIFNVGTSFYAEFYLNEKFLSLDSSLKIFSPFKPEDLSFFTDTNFTAKKLNSFEINRTSVYLYFAIRFFFNSLYITID